MGSGFTASTAASWPTGCRVPHEDYSREIECRRHWWLTFYHPQPGDTVVDVGTSIGYEAVMYAEALKGTGRIVAIEAHPGTFACLVKTCEYNGLSNVTPLNVALADHEGTVQIADSGAHTGNSIAPGAASVGASLAVRSRTLDDICADLGIDSIACVRTNIEGAERLAVRGMQRMIAQTSVAIIACHDFKAERTGDEFFRTKKEITEFLQDHGFRIVEMQFDAPWEKDHVYAYNPALTPDPREQALGTVRH